MQEPNTKAPTQYVALSHTAGVGRFVVYLGQPGETSNDVLAEAQQVIRESEVSDVFRTAALGNLSVMSVSNARRLFGDTMRAFERNRKGGKSA